MYTKEELLAIASKCTPTSYNTAFGKYVVVNDETVGEQQYIHIVVLGDKSNHLYEVVTSTDDEPTISSISSYSLSDGDVHLVGQLTDVSQLTDSKLRKLINALVYVHKINGFDLSWCGGGLREMVAAGVHKQIVIPFFVVVACVFCETNDDSTPIFPQLRFSVPDEEGYFSYIEWPLLNDGTDLPRRRFEIFSSIDEFKKSPYYLSDETKYPKFVLDQQSKDIALIERD
mgnify:FL=1